MGQNGHDKPFFVGNYELSVDTKHRLLISFQVRATLNPDVHGRSFYVLPGSRRGILSLYPNEYYRRLRADFPPEELLSQKARAWRQFETSQTALIDPDNQGRILLPRNLLKWGRIGKEVTLAGVQDHLEIWNREEYDKFQEKQWDELAETRDEVLSELAALRSSNPE